MALNFRFRVIYDGDLSAGFMGYDDLVTITCENPGGDSPDQFPEFMRESIAQWHDGARVIYIPEGYFICNICGELTKNPNSLCDRHAAFATEPDANE